MSSAASIFLVEDEPSLLALYRIALSKIGDIVVASTVVDAITAVEQCVRDAVLPKVFLLDLLIPEKPGENVNFNKRCGFTVLERIRSMEALKGIPIFVMTNLDSTEDRKTAHDYGVAGYIVKSNIVPRDIVEQIKVYL